MLVFACLRKASILQPNHVRCPAQIAGVKEICVVSPPRTNGCVDPVISATARLLVHEVHAVGGAQAVTWPMGPKELKRSKIVGPVALTRWQDKSKCLVWLGLVTRPSEIVVLADEGADPHNGIDRLSQAEHGWGVVCFRLLLQRGNE